MNVTFHVLAGGATGICLATALPDGETTAWFRRRDAPFLLGGLALGVLFHGLLDLLPHTYPLPWWGDIPLALILFALPLAVVRRRYALLLTVSSAGAVLPDIVDFGPPLLNHVLHLSLPTWEIFPWHWTQYSGSLYGAGWTGISFLTHMAVLAACAGFLYAVRKRVACIWRI